MRYNIRHINYAMLLRVLGWLLMIEAGFLMVPMLTAVIYNEADLSAFAVAETVTLLTGIALTTLLRPRRTDMGRHEGFLLTASVWIVFSFFGMIPFLLSTSPIGISDAFLKQCRASPQPDARCSHLLKVCHTPSPSGEL